MPIPQSQCAAKRAPARCSVRSACTQGLALIVLGLIASRANADDESRSAEVSSIWNDVRWKYSTGVDYSRGDYGLDSDTQILFMPLSVEADFFPVRVKLTIPFISIHGPSGVLFDGSVNDTGRSTGLGQVIGSVGYLWVPPSESLPFVEFTGKLTAPTETSDDLGSGEWAVALHGDAFKSFGSVSTFGRFGRKFYTGSTLDDRFYASAALGFRVSDRVQLGMAYDWFQASIDSVKDTHQLSPYAGFKFRNNWSFGPYGIIGLSDGAPEWGLGFTLSVRR